MDAMSSRYWVNVSTSPAHQAQLERIPPASKVLEMGAAGGHMTRALVERGCRVWAIEAEDSLASAVQDAGSRVVVGDIECMDLGDALGGERFDVILLGDVLEHLRYPDRVLHRLHSLLVSSGHLVVSLPNVAHGSVRLALLFGRFDYTPCGLLDDTHLRFFTRSSLVSLFEKCGWAIEDLVAVDRGPFDTEIRLEPADVPLAALRMVCEDPDARAYQFIFRAVPARRVQAPPIAGDVRVTRPDAESGREARRRIAEALVKEGQRQMFQGADAATRRGLFWKALGLHPHARAALWLLLAWTPLPVARAVDTVLTAVLRQWRTSR
jgi:2-polyprenyl-3-methyl-5-hydroxy-6-metoxy-1,4-benzoquinol methylase